MTDYRRFITYIFYYENNQKIRCVGSAKIEQRGNRGRIELSVRGAGSLRGKLPFYFFIRQGRQIQGILLGEVNIRGGSGHLARQFDADSVADSHVALTQMSGFLIWAGKECQLGSQWDDLPTDWRNLQREAVEKTETSDKNLTESALQAEETEIPEKALEEPVLQAAETSESAQQKIRRQPLQQKTQGKIKQREMQPMIKETDEQEMETVAEPEKTQSARTQILETIASELMQKNEPDREQLLWRKNWEDIKKTHPTEQMFSGDQQAECIRMELRDLRLLPRRYWYLGNNSFLLHGFFNYQHLLLGCRENGGKPRWFVGVPGIFHNQEQVMATFFGFHRFCLEKSAPYRTGGFGYWCLDMEL